MPSKAYSGVLIPLLADVGDLIGAHDQGRTGHRGRQWNLSGLNRSIVVISVSAWEAYVEAVVSEVVDAIRPAAPPLDPWPALKAFVDSSTKRFNTPNPDNVKKHVAAIGIPDITASWSWRRNNSAHATQRLEDLVLLRHKIAHGVHPRPTIHHWYAKAAPELVRRIAECTDAAIAADVQTRLGVGLSW